MQEKYHGVSTYAYCFLSPVRYFDPTGEGPWDDIVAWGNRYNVGTRAWGGLKMIGGGVEALAGGTFAVVASETGIGFVAGAAVFVHGSDVASSGLRQMISGQDESSLTSQGLQAVGLSKQNAELIDGGISILGTMGTSFLTSSSSTITANSNRIASGTLNGSIVGQYSGQIESALSSNGFKSIVNSRNIKSMQSSLRSESSIEYSLSLMRSGKDVSPIGGYFSNGTYYINEGNHRMSAAIIYQLETGSSKYVDKLLQGGNWYNKAPVSSYEFPSVINNF